MNNNKKIYKDTFDSLQMSDDALRKVRNMNKEEQTKRIFRIRYAVIVAAIAATFIISNVVVYAATGKTIVEHVSKNIKKIETEVKDEKTTEFDIQGSGKYEYKNDDIEAEIEIPEGEANSKYSVHGQINYSKDEDSEMEIEIHETYQQENDEASK